jgi:leucyl aminopeptidase
MVDLATLTGAILVALARSMRACSRTTTSWRTASSGPGRQQARRCGGCRSGLNTTS